MPFELGIVVGRHRKQESDHIWFVFEANERRLKKSLSDLAETDPYIHYGTPHGVLRESLNALVKSPRRPTMEQMVQVHGTLWRSMRATLTRAGAKTPFKARAFDELAGAALDIVHDVFAPVSE
jgi:hypothetical protein